MSNQKEKSDYYTYGLANPLKLSKESYIGGISLYEYEFFYIGYTGREERLDEHLACKKSDKNIDKKNIIREIQEAGEKVIVVKFVEGVVKWTAISKEIEQIAYYGREDLGLGPLTNRTNGGDGTADGEDHQNFGKCVYNNGETMGFFNIGTEPDGWVKGGLSINVGDDNFGKGKKWYNDGTINKYFELDKQPEGFVLGMISECRWYNNGTITKYFKEGEEPEGFVLGCLFRGTQGLKWYNNGTISKMFNPNEQPEGFVLGSLIKNTQGLKYYNNGTINKMYKLDTQPEGWVLGMFKTKNNRSKS